MTWWRRYFLLAEGGTVILMTVFFAVWLYLRDGAKVFIHVGMADSLTVASALMGVFGSLLGFILASITFLFGIVDRESFRVLRASHSYPDHWAIFASALRACAFASLTSLCGLIAVWLGSLPLWLLVAMFATIAWSIARVARVVWVLQKMIEAEVRIGRSTRAHE